MKNTLVALVDSPHAGGASSKRVPHLSQWAISSVAQRTVVSPIPFRFACPRSLRD